MRRPLSVLICVSAALATALATPGPSAADAPVLDKPRHGADAVRALGDKLPAVAADHQRTAKALRDQLQHDSTLWVDTDGKLFFIDEAPTPEVEGVAGPPSSAGSAAASDVDVFNLQSLPNARRTIHLDFDGVGGSWGGTIGAAWSRTYTGGDGVAEPYSLDSTVSAVFSADERADIYSAWQRVAEDFAPFAINVTTKDPGFDAIDRSGPSDENYGTRVAITSTATSCGCGGVAYVGVFDRLPSGGRGHGYNQPAFVYTEGAKFVAEAATHEAGHNLGLSHDGATSTEYYPGHGDWAPIMGVSYHEPITQWSSGEYAGANNKEDDFAVAAANGGEPRPDSGGGDLTPGASAMRAIEKAGDEDQFTLTVPTGTTATVVVAPSLISPNLDVIATVTGGSFDNPSPVFRSGDVVGGLGSTATLPAGTHTITVTGTGYLSAATDGYSTYGSVGDYTVTAFASPPAAVPAPEAPTSLSATLAGEAITLRWPVVAGETSYQLERYSVAADGTAAFSRTQPIAADRQFFTDAPGVGTWRYQLAAVNPSGASAWTVSAAVSVAAPRKGGGRK